MNSKSLINGLTESGEPGGSSREHVESVRQKVESLADDLTQLAQRFQYGSNEWSKVSEVLRDVLSAKRKLKYIQ